MVAYISTHALLQLEAKVSEHLHHDHLKLRFTTTHAGNGSPKAVIKRALNQSIQEIMSPSYVHPQSSVLLYEKLDVSIVELETKRSLKVIWTGAHNKEENTYPFLLPRTSMIHDLADHLSKHVKLTTGGTGKIRFFEITRDGKMQKEFTNSEMIGNIPDPVDLYAEVDGFITISSRSLLTHFSSAGDISGRGGGRRC